MPNGELMPYGQNPLIVWPIPLNGEAPHLGHEKHLCEMAKRGADLETVKGLVKNPKFICRKCGRAAAKEENLCEPIAL